MTAEHLREHLAASVPRWQLPERWALIDEVPKISVGKFSKRTMREAYAQGEYKVIQVGMTPAHGIRLVLVRTGRGRLRRAALTVGGFA